jgi:hypothetical protein
MKSEKEIWRNVNMVKTKTRKDFSKKELEVVSILRQLKKEIDPDTAETIARLIGSMIDLTLNEYVKRGVY